MESRTQAAMKDAKLEEFRFQDSRHTFASRLPPDPYPRSGLPGHSTVRMGDVYSHTSIEEPKRVVSLGREARVLFQWKEEKRLETKTVRSIFVTLPGNQQ